MVEQMQGLNSCFLRECEHQDGVAYYERRAKLRELNVGVTLWKRDHEPRFVIDWVFDLSVWDCSDQEEEPWVSYTRQNSTVVPLVNSSGCSVRNIAPTVRLRWTDQDLVVLAAD
jgi:hypothetical protein